MGIFDNVLRDERDSLREVIADLTGEVGKLKAERSAQQKAVRLEGELRTLKEELVELGIDKARITEDHARRERELTHMVGLEKKRQEQELAAGKREAILAVKEENLAAAHKRFEEQIEFTTKRFEKENSYVREMLSQVLERLPTVTVDRTISEKTTAAKP